MSELTKLTKTFLKGKVDGVSIYRGYSVRK